MTCLSVIVEPQRGGIGLLGLLSDEKKTVVINKWYLKLLLLYVYNAPSHLYELYHPVSYLSPWLKVLFNNRQAWLRIQHYHRVGLTWSMRCHHHGWRKFENVVCVSYRFIFITIAWWWHFKKPKHVALLKERNNFVLPINQGCVAVKATECQVYFSHIKRRLFWTCSYSIKEFRCLDMSSGLGIDTALHCVQLSRKQQVSSKNCTDTKCLFYIYLQNLS